MTDVDAVAAVIKRISQSGDWPIGQYYQTVAQAAIAALGLEQEVNPCTPISVPDYNDDGTPMMDERLVPPVHRHHFEWVTRQRWVTPWVEVGERETSEELSYRLAAVRP